MSEEAAAVAPAVRRRLAVVETSRPVLARGVQLRFDDTRQRWVLLVPERVLAPDEIAIEILKLCDGERSVADIIDLFAERYAAPRDTIAADIIEMLQELAGSGFLVERGGAR